MVRYLRLLWIQVRSSLLLSMQYRYDFLIDGGITLLQTATALVPLFVVFENRPSVAGWSYGEALLVVGWFTLLEGVLEGAINPSLTSVVQHIRQGTLDFVLLKPADAQFLVSTSRFLPWRGMNVLAALAVFTYAFVEMGRQPRLADVALALALLVCAVSLLYSLWIVTVSAAFYVVKVDNLTHLFTSIFDAARWPVTVFPYRIRLLFTFVIPLAMMTTVPAQALLGRVALSELAIAAGLSVGFALTSRAIWVRSISRYTSASS